MVKLAQTTIRGTELSIAYSPCYSIVLMCYNGFGLCVRFFALSECSILAQSLKAKTDAKPLL